MEMSLCGRDGGSHPVRDMETLTMSRQERKRMTIMAGVKSKALTQVQAAELMGLGYRQAKRVWRRYQAEGGGGLGPHGIRRSPLPASLRSAQARLQRRPPERKVS